MVTDKLRAEMQLLYGKLDPWNYGVLNRHMVTLGVVQSVWTGGVLMELPCAEGILLNKLVQWLRPTPRRVVSCDLVPEAVRRTIEMLSRESGMVPAPPAYVIQHLDLRTTFPQQYAECIVISDVLPYVPEQAQRIVTDAWERVLPGGHLILTSWLDDHSPEPFWGDFPDHLVQELRWSGRAMDLDGKVYATKAGYQVFRKPS